MHIKPDLSTSLYRQPSAQTQALQSDDKEINSNSNALHEHQQKRLQDMQAAVAKMQQLQKNTSPKQQASNRAAMLSQRLQMLKSLLAKLPPGDYKALLQEIKQIAKELKALSAQLNKSSAITSLPGLPAAFARAGDSFAGPDAGVAAETGMAAASVAPVQATVQVDAAPVPVSIASSTEQAAAEPQDPAVPGEARNMASETETAAPAAASAKSKTRLDKLSSVNPQEHNDADDKQLRTILGEAKKLLQEVLNQLKAKHQNNDKESRKLVNAVERDLDNLARELQQSRLSAIGTEAVGSAAAADIAAASASLGSFVNTSA